MEQNKVRFRKIKKFFTRRRRTALFAFLALVAVSIPTLVLAQDNDLATQFSSGSASDSITWFVATAGTVVMTIIAAALGKMITIVISLVIIPILGYNNFGDSNIVSIGWPLVRDIVNMFVIIILLVIAIKTMLGMDGGKSWEQQIPRVFLAVVAVNFSKTISVLIIDAGQVVMMTFVNALRDIAAGNFVSLFQLDSFMTIDVGSTAEGVGNSSGLTATGYLASSYLLVVLLGVVLSTMLILAMVFIYRIVILWVLVIMSPLAFFLSGIKEIIPSAGGRADEWWKTFIGAVMLGPIMTFFLWLALAASSQGSIAASERFEQAPAESGSELISEIFQVDKLLSLFIGLMIIIVGFKASSGAASSLGSFAGKLINEDAGKRLVTGIASMPYTLPVGAARVTARTGARAVSAGVGFGAGMLGVEKPTVAGAAGYVAREGLARTGALSAIGDTLTGYRKTPLIGGFVGAAGAAVGRADNARKSAAQDTAKVNLKNRTSGERVDMAEAIGKGGATAEKFISTEAGREEVKLYEFKIATDSGYSDNERKNYISANNTSGGDEEAKDLGIEFDGFQDKAKGNVINRANAHDFVNDEVASKKVEEFKLKNVRLMVESKVKNAEGAMVDPTPVQQRKRAQDLVGAKAFSLSGLGGADLENEHVREALSNMDAGTTPIDGKSTRINGLEAVQMGLRGVKTSAHEASNKPIKANLDTSGSQTISGSIKAGVTPVSSLTPTNFATSPKTPNGPPRNGENVARGAIDSGVDLSGLSVDVSDAFVEAAQKLRANSSDNPTLQGKIDVSIANATGDLTSIGVQKNGSIKPEDRSKVQQIIKSSPQIAINMEGHVRRGVTTGGNDSTRAISETYKVGDLDKMARENMNAGPAQKAQARKIAELVIESVKAEKTADTDTRLMSDSQLNDLERKAERTFKLLAPPSPTPPPSP